MLVSDIVGLLSSDKTLGELLGIDAAALFSVISIMFQGSKPASFIKTDGVISHA